LAEYRVNTRKVCCSICPSDKYGSAFKMNTQFRHIYALLMVASLALGGRWALADEVKVSLSGSEETPPVTTPASASGTITISESKSVSGSIKTSRIFGSAAHIHVGAPGESGPPIITLNKVAEDQWSVPPGSKLTDEQYASFMAGNLYVNVHSAWHKGGEIRAQLKP
jgi:hypothetical protein